MNCPVGWIHIVPFRQMACDMVSEM
uniref:Uncharacterized protein n=1 Tax=Anguilla anguilla TaxID=7936 RepID=A0A0E9RC34_ANGAN